MVPSCYGVTQDGEKRFGEVLLAKAVEGMEVRHPVGEEMEWEGLEALLRWGFERMGVVGEEHPVLLVDNLAWGKETREKLIQLFFDAFRVPALLLGRSPVLAAFASGRHTGLVLDFGALGLSICPVFDGYPVRTGFQHVRGFGGDALTGEAEAMLRQTCGHNAIPIVIPQEVAAKSPVDLSAEPVFERRALPRVTGSFKAYHQGKVLEDFKEATCQVPEATLNEADLALRPPKYYEFPTGYNRNFGLDRFRLGEFLFQPERYRYAEPAEMANEDGNANPPSVSGLTDLVIRSVQACDVDLRSSVVANVILCGGGASLAGLSERLNADLNRMPTFGRVRVQAGASTNERRNAAWIGGSIVASLGSFQQLWLTAQEYKEHGPSYVERKSP
jgi:actin-related protein